jgi:hypothetical protein
MLKTLADRSKPEQARILTAAVDHLLPHPSPEKEPTAAYSEAVAELLGEIQRSHKVKPSSKNVKAVLFQVLSGELRRLFLDEDEMKAAKARLGQRGDLPAPQYRVEFDPNFRSGPRHRGITRTYVENALYSPDDVQHLLEDHFTDAVSLYVKRHSNKARPQDSYILLVQTRRVKDVQHVTTAWSLFPADVDFSGAKTPLDMLKAFVNAYGIDFHVGNQERHFVLYETIPAEEKEIQTFHLTHKGPFEATQTIRRQGNVAEVAVAYAIDIERYKRDLVRHGVKIEPV